MPRCWNVAAWRHCHLEGGRARSLGWLIEPVAVFPQNDKGFLLPDGLLLLGHVTRREPGYVAYTSEWDSEKPNFKFCR